MSPRFVIFISMIISWLSAFILGQKKIRRFMPVAIFASQIVMIIYVIAYHKRWWKLEKPTIPWLKSIELAYILGPFLIGTVWVFNLTYRFGFRLYMIFNIVLDGFFSYLILPFLEKIGAVTLIKISRTGIYALMLAIATVIYPFQKWQDGKSKKRHRMMKWK
jgi:hypothetical protein